MTEIELRVGVADDVDAVTALLAQAFHYSVDADVEASNRLVFEAERSLVAEDHGAMVGHAGAFTRDLTVPGSTLPAAHVTMVGVAPTHRRRRLLTRMMERQLREVRNAGREPVAVLWASEGRIYPRFGYGLAAQKLDLTIPNRELAVATAPTTALRQVDPADAWPTIAAVYDAARPGRVGWSDRSEAWWRRILADPPGQRGGASRLYAALYDGHDGPLGYALWRTRSGWSGSGPAGEVDVREIVSDEPVAYAALCHLVLSVDLTRTVHIPFVAVDDPLWHLVDEPRRLGAQLAECLWVRLVDLPAALAARRYAADVDVVFEVTDPLLPANAGRWRLTGGPTGASCAAATGPADLSCDVRDLGAAYLGGTSLAALAAAGRVRESTPGALQSASIAFGWHRLPSATEVF
jgi:predicted acetyltransferase